MSLPSIDEVKPFFPEHRICLVKVFLLFTFAVIQSRSCSLYKCAERLPGRFASQYKRLLRFVRLSNADKFVLSVSLLILALLPNSAPVYLVIDRSNWKLGQQNINVLYLGLMINQDCFIPILWQLLDKRGNSNQGERIDLFKRFQELWPGHSSEHQLIVLADREFIGQQWIKWLRDNDFGLVIRLRRNDYLHEVAEALGVNWSGIWWHLTCKVRQRKACHGTIRLNGCNLHYVAVEDRKDKGQYTSFISHEADPMIVQAHYARRWSIEVFFKHCKTNGFNLEDLNLKHLDRVRIVLAVVSFAYVLGIREGLAEEQKRPVKQKKSRATGQRWRAESVFRRGYRCLLRRCRTAWSLARLVIQRIKEHVVSGGRLITTTYVKQILTSVQ